MVSSSDVAYIFGEILTIKREKTKRSNNPTTLSLILVNL